MGNDPRQVYAVLTGDLIDSTSLDTPSREEARQLVLSSVAELNDWLPKNKIVYGDPEIFRGDQWQALLAQPKFAFRAVLWVRAKLIAMGFDTRISVGIGSVDRISKSNISMSDGDAFLWSGHGLDNMNTGSEFAISLPARMDANERWVKIVVELAGAIVSDWSELQAEAVCFAIDPKKNYSQKQIAENLGVSAQAVSDRLKLAKWKALREAILGFEAFDWVGVLSGHSNDSRVDGA